MLTKYEFEVLIRLRSGIVPTQREIAEAASISLGSVNKAIKSLKARGLITSTEIITPIGKKELSNYKVDSAIILAAGMGTRIAPFSYEKPKALLEVRGEILIERVICQLQSAGIKRIVVVSGYMRESLFYLEEKFGVKIVVAYDFLDKNNHASLLKAKEYVANSYIVSSDQFFVENIFKKYIYESSCTAMYISGRTEERIIEVDKNGYISSSHIGGSDELCAIGPTFLRKNDSEKLLSIIEGEFDAPESSGKLWEQFIFEHLKYFNIRVIQLTEQSIYEFDSYRDLYKFDSDFIHNVDSQIIDNICSVLKCDRNSITDVSPIKEGLTNLSFKFTVKGVSYVYRHPGIGTDEVVNRQAEEFSLRAAKELGLDHTFIFEDRISGWKISRYIPNCVPFDYANMKHVSRALEMARLLHASGIDSPWNYDPFVESCKLIERLNEAKYPIPNDFGKLFGIIDSLAHFVSLEQDKPVLSHNDFYGPNFLIHDSGMELIDWEYSAMSDYACDIGNFVAQGSGYTIEKATSILDLYFGRPASFNEIRHCMSYIAIVGFYWYVWAMYKESQGDSIGEWLDIWRSSAYKFGKYALGLYKEERESLGNPVLTKHEFFSIKQKWEDGLATISDLALLEPYRVKRAIIFASGLGTRMLPITINTPKPMVRVNGVRIIETALDALANAGIEDIIIVRGYLADEFDCLLKKYPKIQFVTNELYDTTNNISSAWAVLRYFPDAFKNAYIFEGDLFIRNPEVISPYQWGSNYLGVPVDETKDWCFDVRNGLIQDLHKGGSHCHHMFGISYWSPEDGELLTKDIESAFETIDNRLRFWDDVPCVLFKDHYDISIRECSFDDIVEIDTFDDLCKIDKTYKFKY